MRHIHTCKASEGRSIERTSPSRLKKGGENRLVNQGVIWSPRVIYMSSIKWYVKLLFQCTKYIVPFHFCARKKVLSKYFCGWHTNGSLPSRGPSASRFYLVLPWKYTFCGTELLSYTPDARQATVLIEDDKILVYLRDWIALFVSRNRSI